MRQARKNRENEIDETTPSPKRRSVPNVPARANSSTTENETEVARLTRELSEERKQRTATSEVLHLLSGSHGDLNRLFDTILSNATKLCQADFGALFLCETDAFRIVAQHNAPPAYRELRQREPVARGRPLLRMAETKQLVHIADLREYVAANPADKDAAAFAKLLGVRTVLIVPMLKDGEVVGATVIYRQEVQTFNDREIELLKSFAAQAVIAIENARLLNELRQRTTDLTERTADLTGALEQQTATSDVLQVISSSPGDLEPVFATMLESAARICDANFGNIFRWDGDALHLIATHNTPPAFAEARRISPFRPDPNGPFGRMLKNKTVAHLADAAAEKEYTEQRQPGIVAAVELGGVRTILLVPMLKESELTGVFSLYRQEVRPFTDKQIELVKNFAAQAVIAIENARLLNELRQRTTDLTERTADLTEALEQQTATSEVLQVISSSPGDLEPVFETMLENAVRICDAKFGNIYHWDDDQLHLIAMHNTPPAFAEARRRSPHRRVDMNRAATRMLETKAPVQVIDAAAQPGYLDRSDLAVVEAVELGGVRTLLGVPMLKENELIGAFTLYRQEVRPFTEKQIALVTNFAAQAVIAIENARLLNELHQRTADLTEALEQQTATSEVLKVISSSRGELAPVFATLLAEATELCEAKFGSLFLLEGSETRRGRSSGRAATAVPPCS